MAKSQKDKDTGEKILAAARKVFLIKGMAGARMQDIADEAGMNKALLHYYFSSKEKLFEVIFLDEAKKFFPKVNMIFESDSSLFEKIEQFTAEYIDEIQQNPYLPLFIINEINQNPEKFLYKIWGKSYLPRPEKFLAQVDKEVRKGIIKPISPVHLLVNILSMCIFPFMAKPMIMRTIGLDDLQFRMLMEQRKIEIPKFIIASIKK
ncbi:MAG: TetR/AcrR family transcriptional regulator [Ferruginibacter sp.]